MFDIATKYIIGANICEGKIEFSKFSPHSNFIKLGAHTIKPTVKGREIDKEKS